MDEKRTPEELVMSLRRRLVRNGGQRAESLSTTHVMRYRAEGQPKGTQAQYLRRGLSGSSPLINFDLQNNEGSQLPLTFLHLCEEQRVWM